jgi:hypothetical protein
MIIDIRQNKVIDPTEPTSEDRRKLPFVFRAYRKFKNRESFYLALAEVETIKEKYLHRADIARRAADRMYLKYCKMMGIENEGI